MAKERGPGCRFSRALGVGARLSPPAPASRPVSLSCAHCMSVPGSRLRVGGSGIARLAPGAQPPCVPTDPGPGALHGQHLEGRQVVRLRSPGPVPGCGAGWRGDGRPARPGTAAQHSAQVSPAGFPALPAEPGAAEPGRAEELAAPQESVCRRHPPVVSEEDLSVESSASQDGVPRASGDSSAARRSPPAREEQAWQGGPGESPRQPQRDHA